MSAQLHATIKIGDQVIEQAQRTRTRRDGVGRGVRTPQAMVGVA